MEVTDNGVGITESEFPNVARKHFTSKLAAFQDLEAVKSFGFRGEALAAIANVAKLTVVTRQKSDESGFRLEFDGSGELTQCIAAAHPIGTTVSVADVFRNLPVRQEEFEKNIKREYAKVVPLVQSYALACPSVKISMANTMSSGRRQTVFVSSGRGDLKENAGLLFGAKDAQALGVVRATYSDLHDVSLDGLVTLLNSGAGRRSKDRQFFFVNRRPVDLPAFGRMVTECFREAAQNLGKYPTVVLNFKVPGALLDVNVTPEKRTVFITVEEELLRAVQATVLAHYKSAVGSVVPMVARMPLFVATVREKEPRADGDRLELEDDGSVNDTGKRESAAPARVLSPKRQKQDGETFLDIHCDLCVVSRRLQRSRSSQSDECLNLAAFDKSNFSRMAVIGQFNSGFIVTRLGRDLFIIDQHSSNEIFNFEYLQKTTVLRSQRLISPLTLRFAVAEEMDVAANLQVFLRNGFVLEYDEEGLPGERIKLLARPESKGIVFGEEDVRELADLVRLPGSGATARPSRVRAMFASRACRMSIMIGDPLSDEQMRKVVADLATLDAPWACPHGRPTFLHLLKME